MAKILFDQNGIFNLGSVNREEDLKPKPGININPPPDDGRCECCGKHISQLKPFGKNNDADHSNYDGAYLLKTFRRNGPYYEQAELAIKEAEEQAPEENPRLWLMKKYGDGIGFGLYMAAEAYSCVDRSWECKDCVVLSDDEFFEKRSESKNRLD